MKKSIFTFIFAFFTLVTFSQTTSIKISPPLTEASPNSVGMSAERLARIDAMCKAAIDDKQVPGMVALVARNGKIVYHKAFGMADNKSKRALKRNDIFRIASQTKAITSTAVMMLWEEGKFQLDDPISKYIPEFIDAQVLDTMYKDGTYDTTPASKPITIRHLITHTSGIGYGVIDGDKRFKEIYKSGPFLFILNALSRLLNSFSPVVLLWVGKLIIDEVSFFKIINYCKIKQNSK